MPDLIARLLNGCTEDAYGCWITPRKPANTGYIKIGYRVDGRHRTSLAHRLTYEHFRAQLPKGLVLDHLCRNRACINPWHLEPVTNRVNILRGTGASARNVAVDHCPQGHPYDESNTYRKPGGSRECRACSRQRQRLRPELPASEQTAARLLRHLQGLARDGLAPLSIQRSADALGIGFSTVRRAIRRLVRDGRLRKVAPNRGPVPAVYAVAPTPDGWVKAEPTPAQVEWRRDRGTA